MNKAWFGSLVAIVVALCAWSAVSVSLGKSAEPIPPVSLAPEARRVQAHLEQVESELQARDVARLSGEQRAARAGHIAALRSYREAGIFPHNHDRPNQRLPYFRDAHGTLCAMAYLIERSGAAELVDRVAHTNNNVYVKELASDPEVVAWLDRNGLSLEEAARIQPAYDFDGNEEPSNLAYVRVTALNALTDGVVITWNLYERNSRSLWPGTIGMVTGTLGVVLGAVGSDLGNDSERPIASLNYALGGITFAVGLVTTMRAVNARSRGDQGTNQPQPAPNWSPILTSDVSGRTRLGISRRF
jgi:hypothetical protein